MQAGIGPRQLAMAGAGVVAAAALIFTILGMRGSASPEPVATAPAPRPVPPGATSRPKTTATPASTLAPAVVTPAADAPHWERVTDGRWVNAGRHTAAFEVAATNRTHIWTRDVTPLLVVRCQNGNAEAFVYTQSAARMEPEDGDHTVSFAFDGQAAVTERWPDSAEHDALFARNHASFTTALARSRTLRFGYTPHNAEPVTATFAVDGLSELLASSGRQCGAHK
jgi:hypothetical protein